MNKNEFFLFFCSYNKLEGPIFQPDMAWRNQILAIHLVSNSLCKDCVYDEDDAQKSPHSLDMSTGCQFYPLKFRIFFPKQQSAYNMFVKKVTKARYVGN